MNENIQKPRFYSILPADVRFDDRLTDKAKILYSDITALVEMGGQCYATDSYFATLHKADKRTVQRWLSNLEKCGYIKREIVYKSDKKTIEKRYIRVLNINVPTYGQNSHDPIDKNVYTPIDKNVVYNNQNTNTKNKKKRVKKEIVETVVSPTLDDIKKLVSENGLKINPDTVFKHLKLYNFKPGRLKITQSNLLVYLEKWETMEDKFSPTKSNRKTKNQEVEKTVTPDWFNSYQDSIADWK